jgi:putative addiction module killer protein
MEVRETPIYARWFKRLHASDARARILVRIRRLSLGNPGDVRPVGGGVSELRIDHGPGYRIYFAAMRPGVIHLLVGGDKTTQDRDIHLAIRLARSL